MNPADRLTIVVQTARAVLDGRLDPDEGAAAIELQAEQITPLLRADRDSVTRSECQSVATNLRLLAEQITDLAPGAPETDPHLAIAQALGTMGQALR